MYADDSANKWTKYLFATPGIWIKFFFLDLVNAIDNCPEYRKDTKFKRIFNTQVMNIEFLCTSMSLI